MTRVLIVLCFVWTICMSGCADAPKASDKVSQEEVATAQLNTVKEEPIAEIIDQTKEIVPEIEQKAAPETVEKAETAPVKKKVSQPVIEKPSAKPRSEPVQKTLANISFDKLVHEFGEIDEGDKITHNFKFKNTGNGPLIIDNVEVSCGCTMPTYPIIPIGPGETGVIGVIYNSKGKFGTQKPSITIKTNATSPIVKLYMSGSIKHVFEKTEADTTDTKG